MLLPSCRWTTNKNIFPFICPSFPCRNIFSSMVSFLPLTRDFLRLSFCDFLSHFFSPLLIQKAPQTQDSGRQFKNVLFWSENHWFLEALKLGKRFVVLHNHLETSSFQLRSPHDLRRGRLFTASKKQTQVRGGKHLRLKCVVSLYDWSTRPQIKMTQPCQIHNCRLATQGNWPAQNKQR